MINQIQNSANSAFAPLQSSVRSYAITKPINETQEKNQKERKNRSLGYLIAGVGLAVGFGILLVSQIFSKKSNQKINKYSKNLEHKILTMNDNKNLSTFQNVYLGALKIYKNLLQRSKAVFTLATLKDIPFKKGVMQVPFLNKAADAVTDFFEKISVRTSKVSYHRTHRKFESMFARFRENSASLPANQAKRVNELIKQAELDYLHGFSESARNKRFAIAKEGMKTFHSEAWGKSYANIKSYESLKKYLKDKKTYTKFLAEEVAKPTKLAFNDVIYSAKEKISFSAKNKFRKTKHLLSDIDLYIDPTDVRSRQLMKELKDHLKNFNEKSFEDHSNSEFPGIKIAKDLKELSAHIKTSDVYKSNDNETVEHITNSIQEVCDILANKDKRGEIQDIMEVFKNNLPKEKYEKLNKTVNRTINSFDFSVDQEGDKLFDKIRDLKLGSAIHDVLAFVGSTVAAGWFVGKADTNNDKISAALKYGIPVVGAVTIATLCAVGLIASGPSLIIGTVSGLVFNKLGEIIDNQRKKYNEKPDALKDDIKKGIKDSVTLK